VNRTPSSSPSFSPFPTAEDLSGLRQEDATAALDELRRLVCSHLADVYTRPFTPVGKRHRWNIWFDRRVRHVGDQRVELPVWAAEWVAAQSDPTGGDAA
jgi:hypothetical protein